VDRKEFLEIFGSDADYDGLQDLACTAASFTPTVSMEEFADALVRSIERSRKIIEDSVSVLYENL
jgi:hypothetical protein